MIKGADRRTSRTSLPWGSRASAVVLAIALAASALAAGTVHTITLCFVTGTLAIAAVLGWWDAEPTNMRAPATLLLLTGLALTAFTALQCVPLPLAWLAHIAPHNADVWSRSLAPLHEAAPSWTPLSVDPTATRVEALKGVAYLLAFVTALRISRRRRGVAYLSAVLAITGIVVAIAALLHPAFGARKLYGLWEPSFHFERHLAPFLNPNNLASYINIAFCLTLAGALAPEPRRPRPILVAAAALLAGTQIWVASRGGVIAMILGAAVVIAVSRASGAHRHRAATGISVLVLLALAAGVFMLVLGSSDEASTELLDANVSKLHMFVEALRMVPAYPIFGTGRGAFETAFPAFRQTVGHITIAYPENVIAQWIVEWGVPVGGLGLAAVAYGLQPNSVLARSQSAAGGWAAIVAVAIQNLGDLGSEIPGLMLALVVCACMVVGGTSGRAARWPMDRWGRVPRLVAIVASLSAVAAIAAAAPTIGVEVISDRRTLHDAAARDTVDREQMHAMARASMLRHPGEPYTPLMVAARAVRARDDNPLPWLGATLERARLYAPAHLMLARVVASRSPSQARLEYRLAMEQAPSELLSTVMNEAPRVVGSFNDATELVPLNKATPDVLKRLVAAVHERLPATAVQLDAWLMASDPNEPTPWLRAARGAVEDLEAGPAAPWCYSSGRAECVDYALATIRAARARSPKLCEPYSLRARALSANGEGPAALQELSIAIDTVDQRVACMQSLVTLALQQHDPRRAEDTMQRIVNADCGDDADCARNLLWVADVEVAQGHNPQALALFRKAYEHAPEDDRILDSVAQLASMTGLHAEAADSYRHLARRHPNEPRWAQLADSERSAALKAETAP